MGKHGNYKDEVCGRDGCKGIIVDEPDYGISCSCHINPPCSKCTTDWRVCPECGWSGEEERREEDEKRPKPKPSKWIAPKRITIDDLDNSKIDWFISKTWHSGKEITGVYPEGTTRQEVMDKLKKDGIRMNKETMPRLGLYEGKFIFSHFTD